MENIINVIYFNVHLNLMPGLTVIRTVDRRVLSHRSISIPLDDCP
jgi:hypothetical protein